MGRSRAKLPVTTDRRDDQSHLPRPGASGVRRFLQEAISTMGGRGSIHHARLANSDTGAFVRTRT
ncbi:MAG TPA: hypothetical protein VFA10_00260 [Ktedonobacteraceae bacterium]|nr:hypothetical protein [Ktedonobacteraceae bacterium]